eukprot:scaffold76505_cov17-Tisochrysis_lutea.AAC.1
MSPSRSGKCWEARWQQQLAGMSDQDAGERFYTEQKVNRCAVRFLSWAMVMHLKLSSLSCPGKLHSHSKQVLAAISLLIMVVWLALFRGLGKADKRIWKVKGPFIGQ